MAFRSLRTHEVIAWGGSVVTVASMYYLFIAMPRLAAEGQVRFSRVRSDCATEHLASPSCASPPYAAPRRVTVTEMLAFTAASPLPAHLDDSDSHARTLQ